MRKLIAAVLLHLLFIMPAAGQQNLVPNGSFETYTTCPVGAGQINRCAGWTSWNSGSPDYYNSCHTGVSASVPVNWPGYQQAADGSAYAGIVDIWSNGMHREYLYSQISPMQVGKTYTVSMLVSGSDKSRFGSNGLCIYFFDNGPSYYGNTQAIPAVTPQISFASHGPITDTANWTRLSAIFVADSAYDNIVIGGFLSTTQVTIDTFNSAGNYIGSYYYIDSVVVKDLDTFFTSVTDSLLCAGDTTGIAYGTYKKYNSNNIFTAQLSNKAGDFSSPITIGSKLSDTAGTIACTIPANISPGTGYKVRVIASSPADTTNNAVPVMKIGNPDSTNINTSSNSPLCEGSTLQLSASTFVSGTTYAWVGPASFSSTSASPSIAGVLPVQDGDYRVTMKWYGCEVTDTLSVTVKPLPAKPVATNNGPLCAGDSLHLYSISTSGVSYSWVGPGSFSSAAKDTSITNSTVAMSGDYIVAAHLNGCNRKDTTTVLVKPLPAAVALSSNTPICAGETLHLFSTTSTTGVSYSWTGPGSFSAATQNASLANTTTSATGWYKLLINRNGCTFTDSTYATVNVMPPMPGISHSSPLCVGETLNLSTAAVSGATYSWTGPGNYSSTAQNPMRSNMQFGDTGAYKLATTINGCTSDTAAATVRINPPPFAVIFSTPADSICQGDRVNFTALPNNHGGTPAYQWYVNGQATGSGTSFSTTTLSNQDVIRCDMTENTKCSAPYTDPSNDVTMNVLPWLAPTVSISVSPNRPLKENEYATFTATATNAGNNPLYQWKRNGQDIVGATGSVWSANTLNDNDSISVEIMSNYKCPQPTNAVSNGIVVKVLTGVAVMNNLNGLVLYPNPNNGKFVLKGETATAEELKIEIINAMGQVVYRDGVASDNGTFNKEIAVTNIQPGIYLLKLQGQESTSMLRFTVQ